MLSLRRAAMSVAQKRGAIATPFQTASFSDRFSDRERGEETVYFNKEDEKSLRKLLKKMHSQTKADEKGSQDHLEHDMEGLNKIGLDLSKDQVEALLKWKHEH